MVYLNVGFGVHTDLWCSLGNAHESTVDRSVSLPKTTSNTRGNSIERGVGVSARRASVFRAADPHLRGSHQGICVVSV